MRDLVVLAFTLGSAYLGLMRPWMGVLALAVIGYMNPHRYAWGFSRTLPLYFIVFGATMIGLFFNSKDKQPFPWTRETKIFLFLLFWFTVTTFWSPAIPYAAQDQWTKIMKIYLGLFPTFWLISSPYRLRWLVFTIVLSFGLIGMKGGIFALGTGFSYRVWGPDQTFYAGNNEIAVALNMMLPLILLCASEMKKKIYKYFFYAMFFFCICSVISSWSRGGLLGLVAVLSAIVLTSQRKWLMIPLVAGALVFAVPNLPEEWFERMNTISTYEEDGAVQSRFKAWEYGFNKALAHPLTGGGFETFRYAWTDAHNAYVEVLGEHGFVGFGAWFTLLLGSILTLGKIRRDILRAEADHWMPPYCRALQISFLGYMVGGISLGIAYWDIFYHLVAITAILKVFYQREALLSEVANAQEGTKHPSLHPVLDT